MTVHESRRIMLKVLGHAYASGEIPNQPRLFQPHFTDDELREANPLCCEHYDRLDGLRSIAETYFDAAIHKDDDCAEKRTALMDVLETMRDATTTVPVTTADEQWFANSDIDLMRASVALVAERALETMRAINDGLSAADVVFVLKADMKTADDLLEMALSTAAYRDDDEVEA